MKNFLKNWAIATLILGVVLVGGFGFVMAVGWLGSNYPWLAVGLAFLAVTAFVGAVWTANYYPNIR